eukprot:766658-Hanusia_phi.AAC.4
MYCTSSAGVFPRFSSHLPRARWVKELEYQRLLLYRGHRGKKDVPELRHPGMTFEQRLSCFLEILTNISTPRSLGVFVSLRTLRDVL